MPLLNTGAFPPLPPKTEHATHHRNMSSGDWASIPTPGPQWNNASSLAGGTNDWGTKAQVRGPPSRVPVPPLFPEPMAPAEQRDSFHSHPDHPMPTPISMPEPEPAPVPVPAQAPAPASRSPLFHLPQISFPRIQIGKKGRIPSLRIEFLRESNQVVSSPAAEGAGVRDWARMSNAASSVSAPSTNSRPFATMARMHTSSDSPLPPIPRVSPISTIDIDITRQSPSLPPAPSSAASPSPSSPSSPDPRSAVTSIYQSDSGAGASTPGGSGSSVQDVGHGLFTRKLSTEDTTSFQTVSRNSSAQAVSRASSLLRLASDPGARAANPKRTYSTSSGSSGSAAGSAGSSGSGAGAGGGGTNLRRATTWVPNVLASYSPWRGVVPGTGEDASSPSSSLSLRGTLTLESPTGQIRVADAYRPMPTLEETPEATPATIPTALPASRTGDASDEGEVSYVAEDSLPLPLPAKLAEMSRSEPEPQPSRPPGVVPRSVNEDEHEEKRKPPSLLDGS